MDLQGRKLCMVAKASGLPYFPFGEDSMLTKEINPEMTMMEIMDIYPGAKRALFQKYHIGGCSSCGFAPTDSLEEVFIKHNRPDSVGEAIDYIYESARVDEEMQIDPTELKSKLDAGETWKVIDVREPFEIQLAELPGSEMLTREMAYEILHKWEKDTNIVFYCHVGQRSLEAASYFKGQGKANRKTEYS